MFIFKLLLTKRSLLFHRKNVCFHVQSLQVTTATRGVERCHHDDLTQRLSERAACWPGNRQNEDVVPTETPSLLKSLPSRCAASYQGLHTGPPAPGGGGGGFAAARAQPCVEKRGGGDVTPSGGPAERRLIVSSQQRGQPSPWAAVCSTLGVRCRRRKPTVISRTSAFSSLLSGSRLWKSASRSTLSCSMQLLMRSLRIFSTAGFLSCWGGGGWVRRSHRGQTQEDLSEDRRDLLCVCLRRTPVRRESLCCSEPSVGRRAVMGPRGAPSSIYRTQLSITKP